MEKQYLQLKSVIKYNENLKNLLKDKTEERDLILNSKIRKEIVRTSQAALTLANTSPSSINVNVNKVGFGVGDGMGAAAKNKIQSILFNPAVQLKQMNDFYLEAGASNFLDMCFVDPRSAQTFTTPITPGVLQYSYLRRNSVRTNLSFILERAFFTMNALISRAAYNITHSKVQINLLFFVVRKPVINQTFLRTNQKKLELLSANLSKILNKPVELNVVRLRYPFHDTNILANLIGRICDINLKPYIFILDKIFNCARLSTSFPALPASLQKSMLFVRAGRGEAGPSILTGIKIKLAGRLLKQKIVPRRTVKTTQHGSLRRSTAQFISRARFTTKNKRGSFSITTTIGHRFF